ncbi:MAG: C4-dicarboxylate TRAP transporter substrate-binding protein [Brevinema sp.]
MKKLLILLAILFTISACASPSSKGGTRVLKMSMKFVDDEQTAKTLKIVAENINKRSNGSLDIQVFTGGQLPIGKDSLEQVISGADWIFVDSHNFLGDYIPDFNAITGPLLYNNFEEYFQMMASPLGQRLNSESETMGMKILSHDYVFGFRSMLTAKAITTPADMRGLKIRVPNSQLYSYTLQAMGATTTPLPFTELYAALAQGVVDGLEGSILSIEGTKIYEYRKKYSLTKHLLGASAIAISTKVWDSLTPEQRTIIQEEIDSGALYNTAETIRQEEELTQTLKDQGVEFNDVDAAAFQRVIADVYTKFPKWTPGIYDQIQRELATIRQK